MTRETVLLTIVFAGLGIAKTSYASEPLARVRGQLEQCAKDSGNPELAEIAEGANLANGTDAHCRLFQPQVGVIRNPFVSSRPSTVAHDDGGTLSGQRLIFKGYKTRPRVTSFNCSYREGNLIPRLTER